MEKVQVQNLADHEVGFTDNNAGISRRIVFSPQAILEIEVDMLERLNFTYGGKVLLRDFLSIKDKDLAMKFGVDEDTFENEYNWTTENVDNVLQNEPLERLLDALDFGPEGILDLIVSRAVALPINDISKMKAISDKTGKQIELMIKNKQQYEDSISTGEEVKTTSRRRVATTKTSSKDEIAKIAAENVARRSQQ